MNHSMGFWKERSQRKSAISSHYIKMSYYGWYWGDYLTKRKLLKIIKISVLIFKIDVWTEGQIMKVSEMQIMFLKSIQIVCLFCQFWVKDVAISSYNCECLFLIIFFVLYILRLYQSHAHLELLPDEFNILISYIVLLSLYI